MAHFNSADETALTILGHHVRALRKAQGHSLRGFAAKTGLNRSHLSDIELGRVNVTVDTLLCLAYALDIGVSHLLHPLDSRRDLYRPSPTESN